MRVLFKIPKKYFIFIVLILLSLVKDSIIQWFSPEWQPAIDKIIDKILELKDILSF